MSLIFAGSALFTALAACEGRDVALGSEPDGGESPTRDGGQKPSPSPAPPDPSPDAGPESVTFTLTAGAGDANDFSYYTTTDNDSPSENWLLLFSSDGKTQYDLEQTGSGPPLDCSTCAPFLTPPLVAHQPLGSGVSRKWDGIAYIRSTCGGSQACLLHAPLPAGTYEAKMCACKSAAIGDVGCNAPTCVDVSFTLPGATSVKGLLP